MHVIYSWQEKEEGVTRKYSCSNKKGWRSSLWTPRERSGVIRCLGMKNVPSAWELAIISVPKPLAGNCLRVQLQTDASLSRQDTLLGVLRVHSSFRGRWEWGGFQDKSDRWGTLRNSYREVHQGLRITRGPGQIHTALSALSHHHHRRRSEYKDSLPDS